MSLLLYYYLLVIFLNHNINQRNHQRDPVRFISVNLCGCSLPATLQTDNCVREGKNQVVAKTSASAIISNRYLIFICSFIFLLWAGLLFPIITSHEYLAYTTRLKQCLYSSWCFAILAMFLAEVPKCHPHFWRGGSHPWASWPTAQYLHLSIWVCRHHPDAQGWW